MIFVYSKSEFDITLSLHDDLVRAIGNRELSLLVLLDLNAASVTVNDVLNILKTASAYKTLV